MRASAAMLVLLWVATVAACDDTCLFSLDSECDDGGHGSSFFFCDPGTDCSDCNPQEARYGTDASVSSSEPPGSSSPTMEESADDDSGSGSGSGSGSEKDNAVFNGFCVDGSYWPLFVDKSEANSHSPSNTSHAHTFGNTTFYMPDNRADLVHPNKTCPDTAVHLSSAGGSMLTIVMVINGEIALFNESKFEATLAQKLGTSVHNILLSVEGGSVHVNATVTPCHPSGRCEPDEVREFARVSTIAREITVNSDLGDFDILEIDVVTETVPSQEPSSSSHEPPPSPQPPQSPEVLPLPDTKDSDNGEADPAVAVGLGTLATVLILCILCVAYHANRKARNKTSPCLSGKKDCSGNVRFATLSKNDMAFYSKP